MYNWSHAVYQSSHTFDGRQGCSGEVDARGALREITAGSAGTMGKSEAGEKSGMKNETGPGMRSTPWPIISTPDLTTPGKVIHSIANLSMRFKGILSIGRITYGRPAAS